MVTRWLFITPAGGTPAHATANAATAANTTP